MPRQGHFKQLIVPILFEIWADEKFDAPVVGACGDQALRARPINTIDAPNVMILLLKNHIHLLDLTLGGIVVKTTT